MLELILAPGLVARISSDFSQYPNPTAREALNYNWGARREKHGFYAVRRIRLKNGKRRTLRLHRFLMGAPDGVGVDHKDGNKLNNEASNLRFATAEQQNQAFHRKLPGTSVFRGVCWHKRVKKWISKIQHKHKTIHLGSFNSEEGAARAYDRAAKFYFGEWASTNF